MRLMNRMTLGVVALGTAAAITLAGPGAASAAAPGIVPLPPVASCATLAREVAVLQAELATAPSNQKSAIISAITGLEAEMNRLGCYSQVNLNDGSVLREQDSAPVYVIYGGAKFWITSVAILDQLYGGWGNVHVVPDGALSAVPSIPRDGTVLREQDSAPVSVIYGGAKFWIPSVAVLNQLYGGWGNVHVVPDGALSTFPTVPRDGTILREQSHPEVWLISGGQKHHITSPTVLSRYGGWAVVHVVPDGDTSPFQAGTPIS